MKVVFVGRDRRVWPRLLLYLATVGISRRIWLYRITKEVDGHDALGLTHRLTAFLLAAPALAVAWVGLHGALFLAGFVGSPFGWVDGVILGLSLLPGGFVSLQTSRRISSMLRAAPLGADEQPIKFGPAGLVWASTLVPILGNLFFIAWTQSRLNRFWAFERQHPERGVELDESVSQDPAFLVELGEAVKASYRPGSRFKAGLIQRSRRGAAAWWAGQAGVRAQRAAVRAAGGSTPVWPFSAPKAPPHRVLHVVCGRCSFRFDAEQDPLTETPLLCPCCGLLEVLPSLRDDDLAPAGRAAVPTLAVDCPSCRTRFHALRNLSGPTPLVCPNCGRKESLGATPVPPARGGRPASA